jgi:soluble lytic murein transglycosylase-like protein
MEIKFKGIFKRIVHLQLFHIKSAAWIVICTLVIGNVHIIYAEPFIRLYKNGVIYYYFAQKIESSLQRYPRMNRQLRVPPPPWHHKLSAQEVEPWIRWAGRHHKLPPALIKAVIRVESNFNPAATSPKGAQGLMQLMPGTAKRLQVANPYDIRENIWAGSRYLGMLLSKFHNNLALALAAYNAGPQRVERCRGIPPIKETRGFVRDVCANFLRYSAPSGSPPCGPRSAAASIASP